MQCQLLLLMMIIKDLHTKETNVNIASFKGAKRKLSGQTTVEENKAMEVKKKAPLKAELIEQARHGRRWQRAYRLVLWV